MMVSKPPSNGVDNNKVISGKADTSFTASSRGGNNKVISSEADTSFGASSKTGIGFAANNFVVINSVARQLRSEAVSGKADII